MNKAVTELALPTFDAKQVRKIRVLAKGPVDRSAWGNQGTLQEFPEAETAGNACP